MPVGPAERPTTEAVSSGSTDELHSRFTALQSAFRAEPNPRYSVRRDRVRQLLTAVQDRREELVRAMSADFGHRSREESLIADIWTTLNSGRHILAHLKGWMRPEPRPIRVGHSAGPDWLRAGLLQLELLALPERLVFVCPVWRQCLWRP